MDEGNNLIVSKNRIGRCRMYVYRYMDEEKGYYIVIPVSLCFYIHHSNTHTLPLPSQASPPSYSSTDPPVPLSFIPVLLTFSHIPRYYSYKSSHVHTPPPHARTHTHTHTHTYTHPHTPFLIGLHSLLPKASFSSLFPPLALHLLTIHKASVSSYEQDFVEDSKL